MNADPALVLVRPEKESDQVAALAAEARAVAKEQGLPLLKTYRARRGAVTGEPWQRPVEFLGPSDARGLYRSLHQWRVLVLAFTAVYVRRDPSRQPIERRAALDLETFVEHKAAFRLIRAADDISAAMTEFGTLESPLSCEGEDDPRCLPLHVFSVDRNWSGLSTHSGREAFAKVYGGGRSRLDGGRKRWTRAHRHAYHGSEILIVASRELPRGTHWDVTSERGTARLLTSSEIWKLPAAARGYANVFPDAYVKKGKGARRVWPSPK
jgi:hypothetical protein